MADDEASNHGHRQRLREKFLKHGADVFDDYELMELFLTYAIQRKDVKPIAKRLLKKFHSLSGVFDASVPQLCEIPGLGETSAAAIKLCRELCKRYLISDIEKQPIMDHVEKVFNYVRVKLGDQTEENVYVLFLNVRNCLIQEKTMSLGTVDRVNIFPSQIAKAAVLCDAKSVILCHNHPGGDVTPSDDDVQTTLRIKNALKSMDILLLDHIVVSKSAYYSFREHDTEKKEWNRILDSLEST